MKKLFVSLAVAMLGVFQAGATAFTANGIGYNTLSGNTCEVTKTGTTYQASMTIPATVTNGGTTYTVVQIGVSALSKSTITSVTLPNTITTFANKAFSASNISTITIPASLTKMGTQVFYNCKKLKTFTVESGNTAFAEYQNGLYNAAKTELLYFGCGQSGVASVAPTCKTIAAYAFYYAQSLTGIELPEGLETIGAQAFYNSRIKVFNFPASLKSLGTKALGYNSAITAINVAAGNQYFCSENGVLYDKAKTNLICYPKASSATSYTFPSTLVSMEPTAMRAANHLTSMTINEGFTTFASECCQDMMGLTSLWFPESVTQIAGFSFYGCKNVKHIHFGSKLQKIDQVAFCDVVFMDSLEFPASVQSIAQAFIANGDQSNIKFVKVNSTTPCTLAEDAFVPVIYTQAKLEVPAGCVAQYKAADGWKQFQNIVADMGNIKGHNNAKIISMVTPAKIPWSQMVDLVFRVQNDGADTIKSLGGILTIDGDAYPEQSISGLNILPGEAAEVTLTIPLNIAEYQMELELTKVNGVANESDSKVFKFNLTTYDATIPEGSPEATYANFKKESNLGMRGAKTLVGAIKFTDPALVGCKVIGARMMGLPTTGIENVKLWSDGALTLTPTENLCDAVMEDGVATVKFPTPVSLTAAGHFFGISLDIAQGSTNYWPLVVSEPVNIPGGFYISNDGSSFTNLNSYGALELVLILDKEGFPGSALQVSASDAILSGVKGKALSIPVNVVNYTGEEVVKITYTYTGDGKTHQGIITDTIMPFATVQQSVPVSIDAIEQPGNYDLVLSMTTYNDKVNSWSDRTLTMPFSIGAFQTEHRPIMEEMTGTTCGYCPRGMLGMAEMAKTYPDFIAAAYHRYNASDPMLATTYGPFSSGSAPNAIFDRTVYDLDPFFGSNDESMGIAVDYEAQRAVLAPANLSIETAWNADSTQITAKVNGEFSYVGAGESYKLAYLVTVDGVHCGDPESQAAWKQVNYYEGESNSNPLINTLCNGTFNLSVFNHVIVDATAWNGVTNIEGAAAGKSFTASRVFPLSGFSPASQDWIKNRAFCSLDNINVIVMLLDNKGRIRNARQVRAGQKVETPTGLQAISDDSEQTATYYDLMGRRITNPEHGIFIKAQGSKVSKIAL